MADKVIFIVGEDKKPYLISLIGFSIRINPPKKTWFRLLS
tara:strand:+ start:317 stop:436 length:120 start_codon:yes stop_codon:yes gene_type:complete